MTIRTKDQVPPVGTTRLQDEVNEFLLERRIRRVTPATIIWHTQCLDRFIAFCQAQGICATRQVNASTLRRFLLGLEQAHNPGGVANIWRSVKAYLNWYEQEYEQVGWRNPARRIKVPDRPDDPLPPVPLDDVRKLLAVCPRRTLLGERDRAIIMTLVDTGMRKAEVTGLILSDLDPDTGAILVRNGKGRKRRTVYLGATTRRALVTYTRLRANLLHHLGLAHDTLWVGRQGTPLAPAGLRQILRRRSRQAGIPEPSPHAFRRTFAINALRNGMDVLTLQRLLGHADLSVISRYVKLVDDDLAQAVARHGVVDTL